ncbi:MAG: type I DNA topoisomerase, partial [Candidatus Ventricola sp.]
KIKKGLSAGRVQSVATRMICDRETEIETFEPEEYWHVTAKLRAGGKTLESRLYSLDGERVSLSDAQQAADAKARIEQGGFVIKSVKRGERHKHPAPPFTTSNLQQEASRKLGFTTSKTMQIAQQLYEGVDIAGRGTLGLISYIRTDSVRLSDEAVSAAREAIESRYGAEYMPEKPVVYKGRKSAQDAHEAIRPANIDLRPEDIKASLTRDQFNLYRLVYLRFIACQMADAVYETQQIEIANDGGVVLRSSAERLKFAGFTAVYEEGRDEGAQDEQIAGALEDVSEGSEAAVAETEATQHFTQAPPRYTEASLVRALEEKGIGRPSTYAPTISTILARGYVMREKKQLYPTELGVMITDMMKEHFTDIVDIAFTAGMEEQLDEVEEGKRGWRDVLREFYGPFEKTLEKAEAEIEKVEIKDEVSDVVCDKCGAMMVYKLGRFGRFLACPNFPECRNTKAIQVEIAAPCPVCGGRLLEKTSRKGRKFYGCERYPDCDFVSWEMPVEQKCPKCGGYMVFKRGRKGENYHVCANENCRERVAAPASEDENE